MKKRKDLQVDKPLKKQRKKMEKNLNDYNLTWDLAIEMAIDRKHWNNCYKGTSVLSKNLLDPVMQLT